MAKKKIVEVTEPEVVKEKPVKKEKPVDTSSISIGELRYAKDVLEKLMNADMPVLDSWRFIEFIEKINEILPRVESVRVQLVKKYGTVDAEGNLSVTPENTDAFKEELALLFNKPFDYKFEPFSVKSFSNLTINNRELMFLKGKKVLSF